ncbi:hypothetical protein F4809DRAFT_113510 [Biscogniauxia mediterranea]|nr:hypothetical protein F4809DRAFT_113510 [Biscogniauxia mediterranea]
MPLNPYDALSNQPRLLPASRPERRSAQQQQPPSQAWTAARCHRLLRPLVSRIAALRKEAAIAASTYTSTSSSATPAAAAQQPIASHEGLHRKTDTGTEESEWPMPRKKRARLTYSQRRPPPSRQPAVEEGGGNTDVSSSAEQRTGRPPGSRTRTVKCLRQEQQQQRRTAARGEIVPATPLLRRARGHIASSPVSALSAPPGPGLPYRNNSNNSNNSNNNDDDDDEESRATTTAKRAPRVRKGLRDLDERLSKLRARMSPARHGDLEAIYRSLEVLLKATAAPSDDDPPGRTTRARGPRSFLAMCLRKMPEYIAELEAWERWDAEQSGTVSMIDDIDTSAQIYNELESLGANKGWRHLRTVVRADGLKAVREAISEGLFGDEFSQLLVDLCTQTNALPEAQDLIKALIDRQYPHPVSADSSFSQLPALQPLLSLTSFANKTGCTSFLFREYSTLLSSRNLPQDWLATREFERVWEMAARALCSTRANIDAVTFMIEAISLLCSRKRTFTGSAETIQLEKDMLEATQRTLTSVLTILATMSLLGENETKSSSVEHASLRVLQMGDRLRYILKACIAGLESPTRRRANARIDMVYLALLLSSGRSQGNYVESRVRGSIMSIWKQHEAPKPAKHGRARNDYDNLVSLISSIARGCSRGTSVASHRCLEDLFGRLAILGTDCHIMDNLKGAAAFLLAQQTNNVRDLIYAEKLNPPCGSENGGSGSNSEGSRRAAAGGRTLFTGYRWEETIGEWVTVSPVASKKQHATRRVLRSTLSSSSLITMMTTTKKQVVDQPASDAETLPPRPRSLIRRDTDSVADPETSQGGDVGSSVGNERPRHGTGLGRHPSTTSTTVRARKRPFRASYPSHSFSSSYRDLDDSDSDSDESPAAEPKSRPRPRPSQVLAPRKGHRCCDDELAGHDDGEKEEEGDDNDDDDDKENRVSRTLAAAKGPRRSSGKLAVLLGATRSRASSLSSGRRTTRGWGPYSSDDELCT